MVTVADFQKQLDEIAARCELQHYHHRLEALSKTKAAINPLPNVRALPPRARGPVCAYETEEDSRRDLAWLSGLMLLTECRLATHSRY